MVIHLLEQSPSHAVRVTAPFTQGGLWCGATGETILDKSRASPVDCFSMRARPHRHNHFRFLLERENVNESRHSDQITGSSFWNFPLFLFMDRFVKPTAMIWWILARFRLDGNDTWTALLKYAVLRVLKCKYHNKKTFNAEQPI